MRLSLSLFAAILVLGVSASNVLELDPSNFDSVIGRGKPGLVEFFAPWCGHCKNLAPTYEELANAYSHAKEKVIIAKVDADGAGKPLGQKYGVTGYPTLKWFDANGNVEPYEGGRDLEALASFVTQKAGVKSSIKPPPPPETLLLDAHTFDSVALDDSKDVLVSFTAPWCGHCKNLKPTYENVAAVFKYESNCVVANIDADAALNKPIASRYGVTGYPTIKFFSKGSKEPESYEGSRTEEAFVSFLNERCGTHRAIGGGLSDMAGRLPELDTLASQFVTATSDMKNSIYQQVLTLAEELGSASSHYIHVMEKVVNGSETYVEKETRRLASILGKKSLSPEKLDEIKIKANVLAAFTEKQTETADEKVEKLIRKVTAEL